MVPEITYEDLLDAQQLVKSAQQQFRLMLKHAELKTVKQWSNRGRT